MIIKMDLSKKLAFIADHKEAVLVSENQILVKCSMWNPETKQEFDSLLTFKEDGSFEEKLDGKIYSYSGSTPIRDFLGY